MRSLGWFLLLLAPYALGQSCDNYGISNGSSCACPPGFGGNTCALPSCGGNIFQGSARKTVSVQSGATEGNLTASTDCNCESGWGGFGCNVCQTASACQARFSAFGQPSSGGSSSSSGPDIGQNNALTCNTAARVYAAGHMSCQVINPTLQSAYPGTTYLNILRTISPELTPIPNATAFGSTGTAYAQLFYNGVEQFFCSGSNCTQDTHDDASAGYTCTSMQCHCREKTSFCGASALNIAPLINDMSGTLSVSCGAPAAENGTAKCAFKQTLLNNLFGPDGLGLNGCTFGECVAQSVVNASSSNSTNDTTDGGGKDLSGGVIAGLAVVGALVALALALLLLGCIAQRRARRVPKDTTPSNEGVAVEWSDVSYVVAAPKRILSRRSGREESADKVILDGVSGNVPAGQMLAILGPSGAGKTTLIDILAGKHKAGNVSGAVSFSTIGREQRLGFVPQQDILPATLTVREALLFAARLRIPENVPESEKQARVDEVLGQLGIAHIADTRIGGVERRGVSGGEMRRVSIGLELVARPDVLILDEPTSGLDSVAALKVARVLQDVAHNQHHPTTVIASIHQPSSQLYQIFDRVMLLSHGRTIYHGSGGAAPTDYLNSHNLLCPPGYNAADFLLEIASDPPAYLFQQHHSATSVGARATGNVGSKVALDPAERGSPDTYELAQVEKGGTSPALRPRAPKMKAPLGASNFATTGLTQFEVLSGREWKILRRDKTLFLTHIAVACVLGVFVGGLYFDTDVTIAGFQSRVGCLFFLGALVAFSALSALHNIVESRPLFLRERSNGYYSPASWLLARLVFDVLPLRIIPTIIVSTITYWMAGLAGDAAHFFKFLFILVLYTLAMTLWNFLLGCLFRNGGIAILLSALSALFQMTYAGFFVHLGDIPPVLRWLQWICPLKYTLEALSVNEVGSGLMIQDTLSGVPVNVSAALIMNMLFGFGAHNYYRDVLVHVAFIGGFGLVTIAVVWFNVRERR